MLKRKLRSASTIIAIATVLGGCNSLRAARVLSEPLPPARPLDRADILPRQARPWDKLQGVERQIDVVYLLEAALKNNPGDARNVEVSGIVRGLTTGSPPTPERRYVALVDALERLGPERKKQIRNVIVGQIMAASEANCSVYLQSVRGSQVASRTLFDVTAASLGVAGSLASSEHTAKQLAGLAGLSSSTGAAFDRDVFAASGVELVAREINRKRHEMSLSLANMISTKAYDEWPLGVALLDVQRYHSQCSMLTGLALVDNAVQQRDRDILTAREVAASLLEAGGNGAEIAAAIAGVTEATQERRTPGGIRFFSGNAPYSNTSLLTDETFLSTDLRSMKSYVVSCSERFFLKLTEAWPQDSIDSTKVHEWSSCKTSAHPVLNTYWQEHASVALAGAVASDGPIAVLLNQPRATSVEEKSVQNDALRRAFDLSLASAWTEVDASIKSRTRSRVAAVQFVLASAEAPGANVATVKKAIVDASQTMDDPYLKRMAWIAATYTPPSAPAPAQQTPTEAEPTTPETGEKSGENAPTTSSDTGAGALSGSELVRAALSAANTYVSSYRSPE